MNFLNTSKILSDIVFIALIALLPFLQVLDICEVTWCFAFGVTVILMIVTALYTILNK